MKLYLAGPMTGYPEFNFPAFHEGARRLREAGYTVFSPAEKDIDRVGDIFTGSDGDVHKLEAEHKEFSLREALLVDVTYICKEADGVALLPGWEASKGANAERALALALYLKVAPIEVFLGE